MKTTICLLLASMILLSSFATGNAEKNPQGKNSFSIPAFESIHVHKQGRGIKVQWTMSSADAVSSYDIQCTYEDPNDIYSNWVVKGTITSNKKMLMFSDNNNVFAGDAYYRIVAHTASGDVVSDFYWIFIH